MTTMFADQTPGFGFGLLAGIIIIS